MRGEAYRKVSYVLEDEDGNRRASFFCVGYALSWQDHLASMGTITELYEDTEAEIIEKSADGHSWVKRKVTIRQRLSRKRVPD